MGRQFYCFQNPDAGCELSVQKNIYFTWEFYGNYLFTQTFARPAFQDILPGTRYQTTF